MHQKKPYRGLQIKKMDFGEKDMKKIAIALLLAAAFVCNLSATASSFTYRDEFHAFQNNPTYKTMFEEDANALLKDIQRDVQNFKELSFLQRFLRSALFSAGDVVVVTPQTMPKMCEYVNNVCKAQNIAAPTVLIATNPGFFNAMAQKLFMSAGGIVIGAKLINETNDSTLEGVLAHEIGHIKHSHTNKMIGTLSAVYLVSLVSSFIASQQDTPESVKLVAIATNVLSSLSCLPLLFILSKRFERQADEFATNSAHRGEGLVEFLTQLQAKEQKEDDTFTQTKNLVQGSKAQLSLYGYASLMSRYYLAKTAHVLNRACQWITHNTPLGTHPSHEERISAIQGYLAQQN